MLTDDAQNPGYLPTKKNIEAGMKWLVKGARTDDALFFHCANNFIFHKRTRLIGFFRLWAWWSDKRFRWR
jgi:hypothetical protein